MAKRQPKTRAPLDEWQQLWQSCTDEAQALHDARDRYYAEWDRIAAPRNRLVGVLNELYARHASVTPRTPFSLAHGVDRDAFALTIELNREIRRLDEQRVDLENAGWRRAFDEDDLEDTALRIYLERGGTPYRYGQVMNPDASSAEIANTTEKVTAQNLRTKLRAYCERTLSRLDRDLELLRKRGAGATVIKRYEDEIAWLRDRRAGLG